MRSAEGYVRFQIGKNRFLRKIFVSRDTDITVLSIQADEVFTAAYSFDLFKENGTSDSSTVKESAITCYSAEGSYGAIVQFRGNYTSEVINNRVTVTGKEYLVFVKVYAHEIPEDFSAEMERSYEELLEKHKQQYTPFYDAVSIELTSEEDHDQTNENLLEEAYDDCVSPACRRPERSGRSYYKLDQQRRMALPAFLGLLSVYRRS